MHVPVARGFLSALKGSESEFLRPTSLAYDRFDVIAALDPITQNHFNGFV